ncbi:TRP-domain-containing protein [Tothia fuscella]|uniref:TRP-domain-containing protein n=1 Tax=Tothia fuscella TaxID=1048955 RepID=A0A9P4NWI2_9PEZI|nr:TRP-domain-containing protein [Tothia fuscella]
MNLQDHNLVIEESLPCRRIWTLQPARSAALTTSSHFSSSMFPAPNAASAFKDVLNCVTDRGFSSRGPSIQFVHLTSMWSLCRGLSSVPQSLLLLLAISPILQGVNALRFFESSSLNTCMQESSFAASRFYVIYTPNNNTLSFDINGYSQTTSNVVLDFAVFGYGYSVAHPLVYPYRTKELCNMCPLNSSPIQIKGNTLVPRDGVTQIPSIINLKTPEEQSADDSL